MAIPTWKLFPALVCGNTVVLKPASDTPATATRLVEVLEQAGLPPGVVNLVHGSGTDAGEPLIRHEGINLISFTGSTEVGRRIAAVGAERLKRVSLEMGGKNPQIVMEDADLDLAVEGALWGAFGTTGQRCTATSRLIVHRSVKEKFTDRLVARAEKLRLGNGLDESVEMGPLVNQAQREKVDACVRIGKSEGARLLTGGTYAVSSGMEHGCFYAPTIFDSIDPAMKIAQEEIFGPVAAIIEVRDLDDAIRIANGTRYGLSTSIYTQDVSRAMRAIRDLEAGITYVNSPTIGAEVHLPFGGVKETGNGHREAGTTVLDVFAEWKAVYIDYSGRLQKAQIDG
jgi:aldehyde dehydrogenase (NAD+)